MNDDILDDSKRYTHVGQVMDDDQLESSNNLTARNGDVDGVVGIILKALEE